LYCGFLGYTIFGSKLMGWRWDFYVVMMVV